MNHKNPVLFLVASLLMMVPLVSSAGVVIGVGVGHPGYYGYYGPAYYGPTYYDTAPTVVVSPPQTVVVAQPASATWYYCEPARAYYPYVNSCPVPWRAVPANPPPATPH